MNQAFVFLAVVGAVCGIAGAIYNYCHGLDILWPLATALWAGTALIKHFDKR